MKYLSIIIMILAGYLAMAQGYTRISSQLKQKNDLQFPLLDSYDLWGGAVSGTEKTEVPQERRKQGMLFLDTDDVIVYQLVGGIEDVHWQKFTGGGYWSDSQGAILYDINDVKVGSNLFVDQVKYSGNNAQVYGLRIGNPAGTSAGSNIVFGLNHEIGGAWDIFQPNLSGANGNVFIGIDNIYQSTVTADNNVAIGKSTGYNLVSGGANVYLGQNAGEKNAAGWYNVSIGPQAGTRASGHWNIDLGQRAGYGETLSSTKNINLGMEAGYISTTAGGQTSNISIGEYAGWKYDGDSTLMIGVNAGVQAQGRKNVMLGFSAGYQTNGLVNVYIGRNSGRGHTGDSCIFIGDGVGYMHNGSNRVIIDAMNRSDNTHMIDLQGAQNIRIASFCGKQIQQKADTFFILNQVGTDTKLKVFSRGDTTVLFSDHMIKIEDNPLVLDSGYLSGGLRTISKVRTLADETQVVFPQEIAGWGSVQVGDNEEFSQFRFCSDGSIEVFNNTGNIASSDTDTKFCLYDTGSGIAIKNRMGASKKIRYMIHYSN